MSNMVLGDLVLKVETQLSAVINKQIEERLTLVAGVENELQNISTSFRKIQQVLDDAETRQTKDVNIKEWLEKLEDMSYEMEDVIDEWNTELHKQQLEADDLVEKVWCCFLSYVLCFKKFKGRHDIAVKIKKLNEKLELIVKEKDKYNFLPSIKFKSKDLKKAESTWTIDESKIFGREATTKDLINKLCREENGITTVNITGVGGIGKTTLSQLAFNDKKVGEYFGKRIWVWVGETFDRQRIEDQILEVLNKDSDTKTNLDGNLSSLSEKLLIVFDDVWEVNDSEWEQLNMEFRKARAGIKIVVTTRNDNVAKAMGATEKVDISMLTPGSCWEIIKEIALSGRNNLDQFETVGVEIANKCKGFPLAAKTLGSLLRFRETVDEWKEIAESELWESKEVGDTLFPHLQLSYNDLPAAVKRCFIFCAMLPKGDKILANDLISMWMAQAYLSPSGMKSGTEMEQVGLQYFKILSSRSLFQDVSYKEGIRTCKIHDIVHDFAQYLAQEECVTIKDATQAAACKTARHLSITTDHVDKISHLPSSLLSIYRTAKTRSFLISSGGIDTRMLRLICYLEYIRILRIKVERVEELPREVGKLSHLRLLDVRNTKIKEFPDTICDLYNMQTLNCAVRRLPERIGKLRKLRNLPYFWVGVETNKFGYLKNLNKLRGEMRICFASGVGEEYEEDAKLADLKQKEIDRLHFSFQSQVVAMSVLEALEPHPRLSYLVLHRYVSHTELPSWVIKLTSLRQLRLNGCSSLQSLPPLWMLPNLETLYIGVVTFRNLSSNDFFGVTEISEKGGSSFPNLLTLTLMSWYQLVLWEDIEADTQQIDHLPKIIPRLQQLHIGARKLRSLPYNLLCKAKMLQSIEFEGKKYGQMSSLSKKKPPFVPLSVPLSVRRLSSGFKTSTASTSTH